MATIMRSVLDAMRRGTPARGCGPCSSCCRARGLARELSNGILLRVDTARCAVDAGGPEDRVEFALHAASVTCAILNG